MIRCDHELHRVMKSLGLEINITYAMKSQTLPFELSWLAIALQVVVKVLRSVDSCAKRSAGCDVVVLDVA